MQKSLAQKHNEKLAPRYYSPYKVLNKIGAAAYEMALPSYSKIHPVFHVSQLKVARGEYVPTAVPAQLSGSLEMKATPAAILDCRYDKAGTLEVLMKGEALPDTESTWESAPLIHQQFPDFGVLLCLSTRKRAGSPIKGGAQGIKGHNSK